MNAYARPLTGKAMAQAMQAIMSGSLPEPEIREFLTTLADRGETGEEIAAAAQVLREHAVKLPLADIEDLCDTCGTGGDGRGTFNASTLAALAAAGAGARVVKHGNRAASSRCGSADLLEAMGVNLNATPEQVSRCVEETGFGFCFAPRFHPAMKAVASIRKTLAKRTIFNLIGPLANPAPIAFQVLGVAEERFLQPMAEALLRLERRRSLVVFGEEGLDEVSVSGPTRALEVESGEIRPMRFDPLDFGLPVYPSDSVAGGDPERNAAIAADILNGMPSAARDMVIANAACALFVAGRADSFGTAALLASEALDSGRAREILGRVRALTQ